MHHCALPCMTVPAVPLIATLPPQGEYEEAAKLHERALGIYRQKYNQSHPLVQETMRNKELAMNLM